MVKKRVSTYRLRLQASPKVALAEFSKAECTGINHFVTTVVAEKVNSMKTP